MISPASRNSFTLIELLIVIAIVTILAVVVVLVINPAELLRQARDSNRLSDIDTLNKAIAFFQVDVSSGFLGNSSTTYFSLIDPTATSTTGTNCQGIPLTPPPSWTYRCAASSTLRNVNGTGWVPVDFTSISFGAPLGVLPVDPINTSSSGAYYTYTPGGSWALSALLESQRYLKQTALDDGGYDPGRYEKGDDLSLIARGQGLVGWWNFEEGSGSTATDKSGNNNGTWNGSGAHYATGKVGSYAGQFNGSDDFVDLLNPDALMPPRVSVAAWFKITGTDALLVRKRFYGYALELIPHDQPTPVGGVTFWIYDSSAVQYAALPSKTYNDGQWHHAAGAYDGGTVKLYIDGALIATQNAGTIFYGSGSISLGKDGNGNTGFLNGSLDDVRIYSRPLSAAEIKAIYDATK